MISNVGEDAEELDHSHFTGGGNIKWYSHSERVWQFPKKFSIDLPYDF